MMGHREKLKNGDEYDAFYGGGRYRKQLCAFKKAGVSQANKRRFNRRIRRSSKANVADRANE
ncbi:hypothetical protein OIV19_20175 [Brucella sp. HL-2]|nr:hypothetical protein [Brucella sp. HL-2]MCV9909920.1 hypothetical protein [Brucella sp. HL-2]